MDEFESDRLTAFLGILIDEWEKGNACFVAAGAPSLRMPNFSVNPEINYCWGTWDPGLRLITLSERLFLEYDRAAAVEVLRHEMAHQYVSEGLQADRAGVSHGPEWQSACRILRCREAVTACEETLEGLRNSERSNLIEKVHKLMAHGQCEGATREEAEAFLEKARVLMVKHQLGRGEVTEHDLNGKIYIQRPVGALFKRMPAYYHTLGHLLDDHYLVNYIQNYTSVVVDGRTSYLRGIEIFGERPHVEVAEYVAHNLLRQAEFLWNRIRRKVANPNKRSFFHGLFKGYSESLQARKTVTEAELSQSEQLMIVRENEHRYQAWEQAHPDLVHSSTYGFRQGASHQLGFEAGKSITVNDGVREGAAQKRLMD